MSNQNDQSNKDSTGQRGGSGNFANDPQKAGEAGKKGGQASHGGQQDQQGSRSGQQGSHQGGQSSQSGQSSGSGGRQDDRMNDDDRSGKSSHQK